MRWIDIRDGFPTETKTIGHGFCNILVVYEYAGHNRIQQAYLYDGKIVDVITNIDITNKVTHWMRLPNFPKCEEDNKEKILSDFMEYLCNTTPIETIMSPAYVVEKYLERGD